MMNDPHDEPTETPPRPLSLPPEPHPVKVNPFRRFAQMFVVFITFFLLVRTVILEPFGVPTGSMAPALIGNHRTEDCPRCGYPVTVGEPGPDARPVKFDTCRCPNCGLAINLADDREIPGDRLMVDKSIYHARNPRRWEVAVFRCPADLSKPYVKRVIGLPTETVQIAGGDIYINGVIERKSLAQVFETMIPVFDMNYAPAEGWNSRWLAEPLADPKLPAITPRKAEVTAGSMILRDHNLHLDSTTKAGANGLTYRHWNLDKKAEDPVDDFLAYNGQPPDRKLFARTITAPWGDPVHDFIVEFDLQLVSGSGQFACRLLDGIDSVKVDIPLGATSPSASLQLAHEGGTAPLLMPHKGMVEGQTAHVVFAFVDHRVMLSLDGREPFAPLDLPADPVNNPKNRRTSRPLQMGVSGASVVVQNLKLSRDIHYLNTAKNPAGWTLGAKEYFMLGDNTSSSHDSRVWEINDRAAPGVPESDFLGKPFLIHQPMRPARLTVGGQERVLQSPDWGRIRWMR
jgi:signal peptidase I